MTSVEITVKVDGKEVPVFFKHELEGGLFDPTHTPLLSRSSTGLTRLEYVPYRKELEKQGPLLLRGTKVEKLDKKTIKEFEVIFKKLPENKLDSVVRLVAEIAYKKKKSPKDVSKALGCSLYKAKRLLDKFGLEYDR